MYKRNHIHKKFLKEVNELEKIRLWNEYKKVRNDVRIQLRKAKKEYFKNIDKNCNTSKHFWKKIKQVIPDKNSSVTPQNISSDDFNEYFANIGNRVVSDHYNNNETYSWTLPESIYQFTFNTITQETVYKFLKQLPTDSNNDILHFDTKLLHIASPIISSHLAYIFNMSLKEGIVVDDWKIAKVSPSFKKGDKFIKNNYRPLSVVAHLAKCIETSVKSQLIDYLLRHNFITQDQSAYLKYYSTITSLHKLIDDILDNINNDEHTALCFLDVAKCFDTIDQSILIKKLQCYGIRDNEINWFRSYLTNRSQCVYCNGVLSNTLPVTIGVPQGTVLGPILFLIFINDLSSSIPSPGEINIFADDVVIYTSDSNISVLNDTMCNIMKNVYSWYKNNRLVLSTDKCNSMLIPGKKTNQDCKLSIKLNNDILEQVSYVKYLGIFIDDSLNWKKQLSNVCKKLAYCVHTLNRARTILPINALRKYYLTTFVSMADYAATVWGNTFNTSLKCIKRMEKMAARAISGNYDFLNTNGDLILKSLRLNRFDQRKLYHLSTLIFKSIHGLAPNYLANQVLFSYEVSGKNLRSLDNYILYKSRPKKELFKQSLFYAGAECWNKLPLECKEQSSLHVFKQKVKKYFYTYE
jgi:hypothetical protein